MTAPRHHYPEEHPVLLALSRINASPGSMLDYQFVVEHEDMLREYGMIPDLAPSQEPPPNPARRCFNAAAAARDKAEQAAQAAALGRYAVPVWRQVRELLDDAFNQAQAAQLQVSDFTHHDMDFLNAAWNSILMDLTYAQNLVVQETRLNPQGPDNSAGATWPASRQASLVEALADISRLNAYDQAALLRQLAAAILNPNPDSRPDQQAQMDQAARDAWEAATDLMFHTSANPGEPAKFSTLKPLD